MTTRHDTTFTSGGERCAAWWYPPSDGTTGHAPCVVMAHGFSMTRDQGLETYAERFAAAGVHVLVFDHRYLGDSEGEPRRRFRGRHQREDWRNAIEHAKALDGVDPTRVVLWGFSFSGGHVAKLLAENVDVAAAMVLCPFVSGLPRVLATSPATIAWILPRAIADAFGRHTLIPVTGPPGARAAMTLPGEEEGFALSTPEGSRWRNEISPGLFATVAFHRPVARARSMTVPLWVGRCADDVSTDFASIGRLADKAPNGVLVDLPGDHFAPFHGEAPERIAGAQVAFLEHTVLAKDGDPTPFGVGVGMR